VLISYQVPQLKTRSNIAGVYVIDQFLKPSS